MDVSEIGGTEAWAHNKCTIPGRGVLQPVDEPEGMAAGEPNSGAGGVPEELSARVMLREPRRTAQPRGARRERKRPPRATDACAAE